MVPADSAIPIVLDTDIGTDVDDATALLLLCCLSESQLLSVTTVSGRTQVRALIARRLLEAAGKGSVPVAAGSRSSLPSRRFSQMFPGEGLWLGHEGKGLLPDDEIAGAPDVNPDEGVAQLISTIDAAATPVTILAIGPLTNLALALERKPEIRSNVSRLVVMGSVIHGPIRLAGYELPPIFEYNFNADREAVARVLEAELDTTFLPAELTYLTGWGRDDVEKLRRTGHPALVGLAALVDVWSPIYPQLLGQFGIGADAVEGLQCHLHDSMAVLTIFRPDLFELEDLRIDLVEENGQLLTPVNPDGAFWVRAVRAADVPAVNNTVRDTLMTLS